MQRAGPSRHARRRPPSTSTSSNARPAGSLERGEYEDAEQPGVLRAVRPRAHLLDPAQGRRCGLDPGDRLAGTIDGGPEAALAREVLRLPEVVEDAAAGGDAGHHGLRDRARDGVPRLLPRRARHRPGRAGAIRGAPGARARGAGRARATPGPPGDLHARVDVAASAARAGAGPRGSIVARPPRPRGRGRRRQTRRRRDIPPVDDGPSGGAHARDGIAGACGRPSHRRPCPRSFASATAQSSPGPSSTATAIATPYRRPQRKDRWR